MFLRCKNAVRIGLLVALLVVLPSTAIAKLKVCNHTDLVLLVAVGYDVPSGVVATEGWWRLYPGYCQIPIDLKMNDGRYFVHAQSDEKSTMPTDSFAWGEQHSLCVGGSDFKVEVAGECREGTEVAKFNALRKNWNNTQKVDIYHPERRYANLFRTKVAGVQRLLSIAGYQLGVIDGVAGEKTVEALNEVGIANSVFGFDFDRIFPLLERSALSDRQSQ